MPELRQITFGPGDKLRWLEGIASDPRSNAFDVRVAVAISNRIDKFSGTATISQLWIAKFIQSSEKHGDRGVRTSCNRIAANGHMKIDRSECASPMRGGGRGKSNIYHPVIARANPERPFLDSERKLGTAVPASPQISRNVVALKPEHDDVNPGTAVPSLPKDYLNSSFDTRESRASVDASWLAVKGRLRSRFGEALCAAWFDRLVFLQTGDGVARLLAPSNYIRDHISAQWADALESAWKSVAPEDAVSRVIIIVEQQRAAE